MMTSWPGFRNSFGFDLDAAAVAASIAYIGLSASAAPGAAMIAIEQMASGSPPAGFAFALSGAGSERDAANLDNGDE
jgi:hypothetical protein